MIGGIASGAYAYGPGYGYYGGPGYGYYGGYAPAYGYYGGYAPAYGYYGGYAPAYGGYAPAYGPGYYVARGTIRAGDRQAYTSLGPTRTFGEVCYRAAIR